MTAGNGPISFVGKSTDLVLNPYSWTAFGNVLFLDEPTGSGYSTSSIPNPAAEGGVPRMASDLHAWLGAFFQQFPDMQSKNIHLAGESFAGLWLPYYAQEIIRNNNSLPLNLSSVTIGDGLWTNFDTMTSVATAPYIQEQRQLLNVADDMLNVFTDADQACGFANLRNQALTYPGGGDGVHISNNPGGLNLKKRADIPSALQPACLSMNPQTPQQVRNTIYDSPCGNCSVFSAAYGHFTHTAPHPCFSIYDINTTCDSPDPSANTQNYFGRLDVQGALNVFPTLFSVCSGPNVAAYLTGPNNLIEPPAYQLIPDLVTNHQIPVHFYNGRNDMLVNHIGIEVALQNMTWNGHQGFTKEPSKPFYLNNAYPVEHPTRPNPPPSNSSTSGAQPPHHSSPAIRLSPPKLFTQLPKWKRNSASALSNIFSSKSGSNKKHEEMHNKQIMKKRSLNVVPRDSSSSNNGPQVGTFGARDGITYHLFYNAGHSVFLDQPQAMYSFIRDVVLNTHPMDLHN